MKKGLVLGLVAVIITNIVNIFSDQVSVLITSVIFYAIMSSYIDNLAKKIKK